MRIQKLTNGTFEEELALINVDTNELILKGDAYHDKIDEMIDGFLLGLSYCNYEYKLIDNKTIYPTDKLFDICEFENNDYSTYEDDDEEIDLLESIDEDEEVDKLIEELKIEIRPYMITHKFEISSIDKSFIYYGNIIEAMDETKDCEGGLFLVENGQYKIVYSCQGLEIEDNNDCLREFGVYEDDGNFVRLIEKSDLV